MTNDTNDLDLAMLTPPTRPGPCKAAAALEADPVETRLEREVQAAPHIAEALRERASALRNRGALHTNPRSAMRQELEGRADECERVANALDAAATMERLVSIEVRHGSGKVKV